MSCQPLANSILFIPHLSFYSGFLPISPFSYTPFAPSSSCILSIFLSSQLKTKWDFSNTNCWPGLMHSFVIMSIHLSHPGNAEWWHYCAQQPVGLTHWGFQHGLHYSSLQLLTSNELKVWHKMSSGIIGNLFFHNTHQRKLEEYRVHVWIKFLKTL